MNTNLTSFWRPHRVSTLSPCAAPDSRQIEDGVAAPPCNHATCSSRPLAAAGPFPASCHSVRSVRAWRASKPGLSGGPACAQQSLGGGRGRRSCAAAVGQAHCLLMLWRGQPALRQHAQQEAGRQWDARSIGCTAVKLLIIGGLEL